MLHNNYFNPIFGIISTFFFLNPDFLVRKNYFQAFYFKIIFKWTLPGGGRGLKGLSGPCHSRKKLLRLPNISPSPKGFRQIHMYSSVWLSIAFDCKAGKMLKPKNHTEIIIIKTEKVTQRKIIKVSK